MAGKAMRAAKPLSWMALGWVLAALYILGPRVALNRGMHLLHVFLFAVVHSLANTRRRFWSLLVHCLVIFRAPVAATLLLARLI